MLSNLLAGIRDLRAPLAAGYVWLLAVYCTIASWRSSDRQSSDLVGDIYALVEAAPPSAVVAASVFVAYLVGAASQDLTEALVKRQTKLVQRLAVLVDVPESPQSLEARWLRVGQERIHRGRSRMSEVLAAWAGTGSAELSRRGEHAIAEICDQKVRDIARMLNHLAVTPASLRKMVPHSQWLDPTDPYLQLVAIAEANTARPRSSVSNEARAVDVSREVIANLDMVKLRLLTVEPLLHAEIDRVEAESAIRLAVVPPLLALTAVLVVRGSLWWLATLPLLLVVWHQGIQHRKTRGDRIADALTLGRVAAPYLERLLATASEAAAVAENPGRTSPPLV